MKKKWSLLLFVLVALAMSCTDRETEEGPVDKTANLRGTGDSANDILSNTRYDKLEVEIAYVTNFRPTNQAMREFREFLQQHTFKEDIQMKFTELPSPDEEELTIERVAELESQNRTAYTRGSTLAVYIYFADAPAEGDEMDEGLVTLGAVYRNTSMIIHAETIRRLAATTSLISRGDVEGATLNHEFGHLFGLVNLGSPPVNPEHEDTEAPNHCNVAGCLMRAELQFGVSTGKTKAVHDLRAYTAGFEPGCVISGNNVLQLLGSKTGKGAIAPGLGEECLLDLEANGGR
ncbi:hypothetical protein [Maribacter sp. 2307ULW6-5]|uniref:hypothetical protein n=1 Tax=Maribacter sp. 2307ULW6-5 TaxID=3386275 RepID=UPI0039BD5BE4